MTDRGIVTFSKLGRYGRFANQMYQVAGTIGIARRNGYDFAFPVWRNYDGLNFEPDLDIETQKEFEHSLPVYVGPPLPELGIPWGYHDVRLTRSVSLLGHFQSQKYFDHCLDEVRWYLQMKDEPRLNDYCAIHWRAGDYGPQASPQHPDGNSYHPRMALNYYAPAIAHFGSEQKFLVFSDDINGARSMLGRGERFRYEVGRTYFQDFKHMKRCRHFIIANSSYSAMAAVLGEAPDKQVVAPFPWFGGPYAQPGSALDPKDIYNPEWKVIDYANQTS